MDCNDVLHFVFYTLLFMKACDKLLLERCGVKEDGKQLDPTYRD